MTLSVKDRLKNFKQHIDPGFINYRRCFSFGGKAVQSVFKEYGFSDSMHHLQRLQMHHWIVSAIMDICLEQNVPSLAEVLIDPVPGYLFCGAELFAGTKDIYDDSKSRIMNQILLPFEYSKKVFIDCGKEHFVASTGRSEQYHESYIALVGSISMVNDEQVIVAPLIMGAPSFSHPANDAGVAIDWLIYDILEIKPEEINEFSKMKTVEMPAPEEWMEYMSKTSEQAIKEKICKLLKELPPKDWGGEEADLFAGALHVGDNRLSASFAFKGPARFKEMVPTMLGKNGDQIYRMSNSPADLLVVQHCHNIGTSVRSTLRAFAMRPQRRRFCLIDGRDTYRLLKAYDLLA
jgi:hypothetical protein